MTATRTLRHVVVVGSESPIGGAVAAVFATHGVRVTRIDLSSVEPGALSFETDSPVDLAIFADDHAAAPVRSVDITRRDFEAGLARLTFAPFRLANLIRPYLSPAARLVLLTRSNAGMTVSDAKGGYLERPFRAAAHALWCCMSVEWRPDGIECAIVAIDDPTDAGRLIEMLRALSIESSGCRLHDINGKTLAW